MQQTKKGSKHAKHSYLKTHLEDKSIGGAAVKNKLQKLKD